MGRWGAVAVLVAVSALGACGSDGPPIAAPSPSTTTAAPTTPAPTASTASPTASPQAAVPRVTMTTRTRKGVEGTHRWTAQYPTLHGLPADAARKANAALTAAVDASIGTDQDYGGSSIEVTPGLSAVDDVYVTVHLHAYFYADGAAHGLGTVASYVFDRASGRRLTLTDFFQAGTRDAALRAMSGYARTRLPEVLGESFTEPSGIEPTIDNFATVTPLPEGLEVTFAAYQVGPYVIGTPTMTVPWSVLERYVAVPLPGGDRDPDYRDGDRGDSTVLTAAAADPRVGRVALSRPQVAQWDRGWAVVTAANGDRVALRSANGAWRVVDVGPTAGCTAFPAEIRLSLALRCS